MSEEPTRILQIEDDPVILEVALRILRSAGYEATGLADPDCSQIDFNSYDLLLLDWMLPDTDGVTIARTARESGYEGPILFVSSKDFERKDRQQMDEVKARWLAKPFGPQGLLRIVREMLAK